jgi:hypothetical protein
MFDKTIRKFLFNNSEGSNKSGISPAYGEKSDVKSLPISKAKSKTEDFIQGLFQNISNSIMKCEPVFPFG